jgi:hypothetical protein
MREGEGPADREVGVVDGEGVPVRFGRGEQPAPPEHAAQFGQGARWAVEVYEDTVGAGLVDAARSTGRECASPSRTSTLLSLAVRRRASVIMAGSLSTPMTLAPGADRRGQRGQVGARAAANVQDRMAGPQIEGVK